MCSTLVVIKSETIGLDYFCFDCFVDCPFDVDVFFVFLSDFGFDFLLLFLVVSFDFPLSFLLCESFLFLFELSLSLSLFPDFVPLDLFCWAPFLFLGPPLEFFCFFNCES